MDFHILPECYLDTSLIETLVPPDNRKGYNHQKGCNTVAKKMQEENSLKDAFALGIIDKDKRQVRYTQIFDEIVNLAHLKLLKHPQKHHYFILIDPALEQWLLNNAREVELEMSDFGLPNDLDELCRQSKTLTSKHDERFKRLFRELKNRGAPGVVLLAQWVTYLKEQPYTTDVSFFTG